MSYTLTSVTIRTDNTPEGIEKIGELWADVAGGKLPILFDSAQNFQTGISPISRYSNYAGDETGAYDLSVMGVTADFFQHMEHLVSEGVYRKYDEADESGDIGACTRKAWERVWAEQKNGGIVRAFTMDYESSVPAEYTKDGKAHCYLYIAVR